MSKNKKNARAKQVKLLFFIVKSAKLLRSSYRRGRRGRRGCLSSLVCLSSLGHLKFKLFNHLC